MPRSDQMPSYRANLPRTGHNLSHDFGFTATCAHLLPVFHDVLNPGETVTLGFDFILRTQPLEAAAMSKLKTHTEYFFVPMQMLYQGFSDWYYGIHDQYSSFFEDIDSGGSLEFPQFKLPKVNIGETMQTLYNARAQFNVFSTSTFEAVGRSSYRFFDMLGFRPKTITDGVNDDPSNGSLFPYQILAYNCIYEYYYRLDTREKFHNNYFNVDRYFDTGVIDSTKFANACVLKVRPYDSDYFTDLKVSPIVDALNLNNKTTLEAAKDFLTRDGFVVSGSSGTQQVQESPFSRTNLSQYIQTQFGMKRSDNPLSGTTYPNSAYTENGVPIRDSSNNPALFFGTDSSHNGQIGVQGTLVEHPLLHTHGFASGTPANGLDIGTANIRAMFASEKLWSVTGRAKKNYDDQTLAHFGFKVPHDPKHNITCFGHDTSEIAIGEVISTSNTSTETGGSPLGEIAGKGYGAQRNSRHKFTAPCHGVVMAIFSVVPEIYYEGTFAKYNKISDRSDLYQPEYDHLGMQPLFGYEVNIGQSYASNIVGWQYRYEQWKRRYNRVTGVFNSSQAFAQTGSLSSWIHSQAAPQHVNAPMSTDYGAFMNKPDLLNDLFLYQYSIQWSETYRDHPTAIYEGDPFVVASHIDCVKVSTMSDFSLPRLDA